jgi:hypothetical protein
MNGGSDFNCQRLCAFVPDSLSLDRLALRLLSESVLSCEADKEEAKREQTPESERERTKGLSDGGLLVSYMTLHAMDLVNRVNAGRI